MGIKLTLNLDLKIGTKLALSLAEKSFNLCELHGGEGCLNLTLALTLNLALNLSP
jgi:hypothetical protein